MGSLFPNQGLNLCPLHWKHRVLTLEHQESPKALLKPLNHNIHCMHGIVTEFVCILFHPKFEFLKICLLCLGQHSSRPAQHLVQGRYSTEIYRKDKEAPDFTGKRT